VTTTNHELYKKLKIGLYAALAFFAACVIAYCFVIAHRNKNYDDLVCLIICFVIFFLAGILALRVYESTVFHAAEPSRLCVFLTLFA